MSVSKAQDKKLNFLEKGQFVTENQHEKSLELYDPHNAKNLKKEFEKSLFQKYQVTNLDEVDNINNYPQNPLKQNRKLNFPKFLMKNPFQKSENEKLDLDYETNESGVSHTSISDTQNINSITSVFSKDHEEVDGLRRVFKKSISFLAIHLILFLGLTLSGLFLFSLNPLLSLGVITLYLVFTNIFFIVVADKSYVFLALLAQAILLIFSNSLFGLGFDPITLIVAFIIVLFNYLAYLELEKIQLSSRLFSVSHITGESTRILLTSVVLILSLGTFNSVINEGSGNFIERVLLENTFVMDNFAIDGRNAFSANRYLMGGQFTINSTDNVRYYDRSQAVFRNATYRDFLKENYRTSDVLTPAERELIRSTCETGFNSPECDDRVRSREDELLKDWNKEAFLVSLSNRGLNLEFEDELSRTDLEILTKQLYQNQINQFESVDGENDLIPDWLLLVPLSSIIPAFFAIGVFFLFTILKFVIAWVATFITWVVWSFLKWTGMVQIDIETVESEIVTI